MAKSTLSFDMDGEEEAEESSKGNSARATPNAEGSDTPPVKKAKLSKNPNVDTSFLPDREREEAERKERERLRLEWLETQETIKAEEIEVTYSYWDGTGHRKSVMVRCLFCAFSSSPSHIHFQCKKGETISSFLEKARQQFPELRGVNVDNMMYIKEDVIVPGVRPHPRSLHTPS